MSKIYEGTMSNKEAKKHGIIRGTLSDEEAKEAGIIR